VKDPGDLQTRRLVLTPLAVGDADGMVGVLSAPELYAYTGGSPPPVAELRARYAAQVAGSPDPAETWLNWIVRSAETGEAIGFVQATVRGASADVAWVIGLEWQENGYASEAANAMCEWLLASGVERLTAHIHPSHEASERVAGAVGLAPTGSVDEDGEVIWAK
jgi:RimJ/RimL family protein N-acetyltransferase